MRADKTKILISMARACFCAKTLALAAKMPESTVKNVISGRNVRPSTFGRIAHALGVDVTEIMEDMQPEARR